MTDLPSAVRWQLWIVAFGFFMQSLDTTIVNTALLSMAVSLGENPLHMHRVVVSCVLTVMKIVPRAHYMVAMVTLMGWYSLIPPVLFLQGMINSTRFSTKNTLMLKDLPDHLTNGGNSLLSGSFSSQHLVAGSAISQTLFLYTWPCMALLIALPALLIACVPNDTTQNVVIARRKRKAS